VRNVSLFILAIGLTCFDLKAAAGTPEEQEIDDRIERFYRGDVEAMDLATPKYDDETGQRVERNAVLKQKGGGKAADPLYEQAQLKASDRFRKKNCDGFLKRRFPKLKCQEDGGKATAEKFDKVTDLTDTWIPRNEIIRTLDQLPVTGKTKMPAWSDDYWRIQWGITSYRYSDEAEFENYRDWKKHYSGKTYVQPGAFMAFGQNIQQLIEEVLKWSPAEKYDLTVGDADFTMTNAQREETEANVGKDNDVEPWMGICHGWAAASLMVAKALKSVVVDGINGVKVKWLPNDIRAMASLAWANGDSDTNFVGGRCNGKKVKRFPNGRLAQQECFDNNPATFHLALGNMVGQHGYSFVMDKTFDYEVWNQPIYSYRFTYFNPLNPKIRGKEFDEKYVAKYDAKFKAKDRFQKPLTRGTRDGDTWNDRSVAGVVGVIVTVSYVSEVQPTFADKPSPDMRTRYTATYDLELNKKGEVTGGEWHSNNHPDFLWVPKKDLVESLDIDENPLEYKGKVNAAVTETAVEGSKEGYPLCQVLSHLVNQSRPKSSAPYQCGI